jgi:hypothetical protein
MRKDESKVSEWCKHTRGKNGKGLRRRVNKGVRRNVKSVIRRGDHE